MCAIADANISHEIFGANRPRAGEEFFSWIQCGPGRLVAGGKLFEELRASGEGFRVWANQAVLAGRLIRLNDEQVEKRTSEIENLENTKSDDPHVLAVAQIGGARLLYSNDRGLHADFRNKDLIDGPRGKVYSTLVNSDFTDDHRDMLRKSVCQHRKRRASP